MISDFEAIQDLCKEIDAAAKSPIQIYLIGGAMLLYHDLKIATKDIDVIVDTKQEFDALQKILYTLGFKNKILTNVYKRVNLDQQLVRDDFLIDIFQKTVCKQLSLSSRMKKRAQSIRELEHIELVLCSREDVFLLKTLTEREGDIQDCISLAQTGIDWDVILEEIQEQIRETGEEVWITYVGERLSILQERNVVIPIMNKIEALCETYYDKLEKIEQEQKKK